MRNDLQKPVDVAAGVVGRSSSWNGFSSAGGGSGLFSKKSLSNYVRIVSSGASNVASSVRSAGASIVSTIAERHDDPGRDQVVWAGFDKLECENGVVRQVLLLGYRSGFQVWDVESADDVRQLVSRHEGSTYFLQMLKKPFSSKKSDKFADFHPLLAVTTDGSAISLGTTSDANGYIGGHQELDSENLLPTCVRFYSLRIQDYVHVLKFRTSIFSVRCSPRVVAISQASQIHCFNAATLEREYTILTYPMVSLTPGSGIFGYGPLAVGTRWLAYTASPVAVSGAGRVSPQEVSSTLSKSMPPNGSLVAHYAKESSKQLAAGLVTLGDMGYKKLSKYYSELVADNPGSIRHVNSDVRVNGALNPQAADDENAGTVLVRDIVSKALIVQFRAHTSPISALCFDPSGTLLVTASIHGHNINVFQIMPSPKVSSDDLDRNGTALHLYRLQRGITNAVIQDISFSDDSKWIMVSSSRGTSHLYPLPSTPGTECNYANIDGSDLLSKGYSSKSNEQKLLASGTPISLSAISRIRNGSNGLKGAVSGAAAAATGKISPLSGAIASVFHNCKGASLLYDAGSLRMKNYLLVFTPSGSIIQYVLRHHSGDDFVSEFSGLGAMPPVLSQESESRLAVDALQKWDVCHKRSRRDRGDNVDIYCDNANGENNNLLQKGMRRGHVYPTDTGSDIKTKQNAEEAHQMYISEFELHMHEVKVPLWAKPEVCFHVMEGDNEVDFSNAGGEIEIERILTHSPEARSKELVQTSDNLQVLKFQNLRANSANVKKNGLLIRQKSGLPDNGRLACRTSSSSLDFLSEDNGVTELQNGPDGDGWVHSPKDTDEDFVNNTNNLKLKKQLESVNNDEGLNTEAQLKTVNSIETEDGWHG